MNMWNHVEVTEIVCNVGIQVAQSKCLRRLLSVLYDELFLHDVPERWNRIVTDLKERKNSKKET